MVKFFLTLWCLLLLQELYLIHIPWQQEKKYLVSQLCIACFQNLLIFISKVKSFTMPKPALNRVSIDSLVSFSTNKKPLVLLVHHLSAYKCVQLQQNLLLLNIYFNCPNSMAKIPNNIELNFFASLLIFFSE